MQLLDLPHEILHNVIVEVDPSDLGKLARTCRTLSNFIRSDNLAFKQQYIRNFDPIKRDDEDLEPDWRQELQSTVRLCKLLESEDPTYKETETDRIDIIRACLRLLSNASYDGYFESRNVRLLEKLFQQQLNIDYILCGSSTFAKAGSATQNAARTREGRHLSAKLHCYYGVPVGAGVHDKYPTHCVSRARVYDFRQYTQKTLWGPFKDDGSRDVDWERMEAVMIDLGYNINYFLHKNDGEIDPIWSKPFSGAFAESVRRPKFEALLDEPELPIDARDPYNVTGTWTRLVCFLDYRDLFRFNFPEDGYVPDGYREPLDEVEAIRWIIMKLRVSKIESPGPNDRQGMPVVHFTGRSEALQNAFDENACSKITGSVRMTPEGEVHWTTLSIYDEEVRWRSEGIQVGGVNAARGVIGNWFDAHYDRHGPAGPTAFWKISNQIMEDELIALIL